MDLICPECHQPLLAQEGEQRCQQCNYNLRDVDGIWSSAQDFVPSGFSDSSRKHLEALEDTHFWFDGRRVILEKIIKTIMPDSIFSAIEVGCGNGTFLQVLDSYCDTTVGVEGHLASLCSARNYSTSSILIHSDVSRLPIGRDEFDFACALDVLEHLDPLPFLREMHRIIKPGGRLLLTVPAFQSLWSSVDERAGHRCRYRLKQLREELEECGFRIIGRTHYQFLLFPLVWLTRRLTGKQGRHTAEISPPSWVSAILRSINAIEVHALSRYSLPFGSSLMVWAEPI